MQLNKCLNEHCSHLLLFVSGSMAQSLSTGHYKEYESSGFMFGGLLKPSYCLKVSGQKIGSCENKNLTCRKCTTQSCQSLRTSYQETPNILLIQINRLSVSNLHGRPRKNNHPFGIYENIKLGLIHTSGPNRTPCGFH